MKKELLLSSLLAFCSWFIACSSSDVAGILIETNTGNKVLIETNTGNGVARVMVSVKDFEINEGDTLQLLHTERDTVGDSVFISTLYFERIADNIDMAKGYVEMDSVPAYCYETLVIYSTSGTEQSIDLNLNVIDGRSYRIDSTGISDTNYVEHTMRKIRIDLPEGFEDLASSKETFNNIPLPIRLDTIASSPCLIDANQEIIPLAMSFSDSLLYWGRLSQASFAEDGSLQFDLLENCSINEDIELSRHTENFDGESNEKSMDAPFGSALWTDSTDAWRVIDNFEPFTNNGTQMSISLWIKGDSASQGSQGKSYTRILSAKKDSSAFVLQQRNTQAAVNLRIDAHANGKGVYNSTFGNARILDGTWHNYAFTIRGDSVFTYADGVTIGKTFFENGSGFAECNNPAIGYENPNFVGGLDEIFFFDGSQSENWMRLFYALQKSAMK